MGHVVLTALDMIPDLAYSIRGSGMQIVHVSLHTLSALEMYPTVVEELREYHSDVGGSAHKFWLLERYVRMLMALVSGHPRTCAFVAETLADSAKHLKKGVITLGVDILDVPQGITRAAVAILMGELLGHASCSGRGALACAGVASAGGYQRYFGGGRGKRAYQVEQRL